MSPSIWRLWLTRRYPRRLGLQTVLVMAIVSACLTFYLRGTDPVNYGECKRPILELWHPSIRHHFSTPKPLTCSQSPKNWVYVKNGTFVISEEAIKKYGNVTCEYRPLVRMDDNSEVLRDVIRPFSNGTRVVSDFFETKCNSQKGHVYENIHTAIKPEQSVLERAKAKRLPQNAMGLNVMIFGFDSVSRLNWLRNLPKSYAYFTEVLGGVVLEGYNIVGDGTTQALLPILTGHTDLELPEARRGFPGAKPVDGFPWIWKDFVDAGYVTQWGEDAAGIGTFTYRMLGFKEQPVDHYYRHYQRLAEAKYYENNPRFCMGSEPRLDIMMKWMRDFFEAYPTLPKFTFVFHSEYSHEYISTLSLADETLRSFLQEFKTSGYLNNTLLILMADHGSRYAEIRESQQGKYEERLPYYSFAFPKWFAEKYPIAMKNLRDNVERLTSPFDIHATLKDVLNYTDLGSRVQSTRGMSLFQAIPRNRTCSDAGIAPHWCTCLVWKETPLTDDHVISAANQVVSTINDLTNDNRQLCVNLTLDRIVAASKFSPNEKLLTFKRSVDLDGHSGDFSDKMAPDWEFYQITIKTKPSDAVYEATVTHDMFRQNIIKLASQDISRINRYGDQPHCIRDRLPHLRPYCYCTVQASGGSLGR
ncbi:hypothetical protein LSH36_193g02065 [Paralvinella palmiformis]|uniref:DUF229 domain containing protein n=1 Tax=Paralvinella palmiformis TaxID=53620 RepID=A0AAD9JQY8_9ANNE|nr:hypothetical protein LSH36_193g02065 [Paralvinella palmiformis]